MPQERTRDDWVDVLRFLGILAIYAGHLYFPSSNGQLHFLVFQYHVELFFFISGFYATSRSSLQRSFKEFCVHQAKRILIPYFIFSLFAILKDLFAQPYGLAEFKILILQCLAAKRNSIMAAQSLWFLPCLFVVTILYRALYLLLKNKYFIMGCSLVSLFAIMLFHSVTDAWFFTCDEAFQYLFFYSLGAVSYPFIKDLLAGKRGVAWNIAGILVGAIGLFFMLILYLTQTPPHVAFTKGGSVMLIVCYVITTLLCFAGNLLVAKFFQRIGVFRDIGKNTLFLCGTEQFFWAGSGFRAFIIQYHT